MLDEEEGPTDGRKAAAPREPTTPRAEQCHSRAEAPRVRRLMLELERVVSTGGSERRLVLKLAEAGPSVGEQISMLVFRCIQRVFKGFWIVPSE